MSRFSGFLSLLAILTLALFAAGVLAPLAPTVAQMLGLAPPSIAVLILSVFGLWLIVTLVGVIRGAPRLARIIEPLDPDEEAEPKPGPQDALVTGPGAASEIDHTPAGVASKGG